MRLFWSLLLAHLCAGTDGTGQGHRAPVRTALAKASRSGHADVVRLLLEAEADLSLREERGCTALHIVSLLGCLLL